MDIAALKKWFQEHKRELPWRSNPTPYRVWISEVMLQQTQAAVVVGYFERWMRLFPTIQALAEASLDEVIKAWEGLGYYARARHLHAAAQELVLKQGGELPAVREELAKIKGLGPYTISAILSFAFHQKSAAVDGNVARVVSRYFLIEEDISKSGVKQKIQELVLSHLPDVEPWLAMEGLIELGARVCQRIPKCSLCPLQKGCLGLQSGRADLLPIKGKRPSTIELKRYVAVIEDQEEILLQKVFSGRVMAGLYEFPYFEKPFEGNMLGLKLSFVGELPMVKHSFTRFRAELYPTLWRVLDKTPVAGYEWIPKKRINELPFSAGHRRLLKHIVR
jgi:A/G-specific adenine glycosylase